MDGQAKVSLILELKNRMTTGLTRAKQQLNQNVRDMKGSLDGLKSKWTSHWSDMKNQMPGVGNAIGLLKNPLTLIAGGLALIGIKARQAIAEAERFSEKWREVAMLNIDKPAREMEKLKRATFDTAYTKGFDHTKTAEAMFDVQSVTGKFGKEVDLIVRKQGEFSQVMKADFNSWIAGTGKAMANYGFGAERLDEFNRAAFATVKTGVTTFDQLSQVMSVYAGAASAAKQDFSAANKMFSLFSVKVKSVDEAATLTKSLFNDLTKETTVKAFENIGISMYDNNGKFRQADAILLDLNKKFRELGNNDSAIIALKNQFQGSEGLISYIQTAMDKTGQLQGTLSSFDATELGMNKAFEIAKNDINYINEQLENKTKTLMAEFGTKLLPIKSFFLQTGVSTLDGLKDFFTGTGRKTEQYRNQGASDALEAIPELANALTLTNSEFSRLGEIVNSYKDFYGKISEDNRAYEHPSNRLFNATGFYEFQVSQGALKAISDMWNEAFDKRSDPFFTPLAPTTPGGTPDPNAGSTSGGGSLSASTKNITGASQPVKNVTVNIDSFVKGGINTQHTNLQQMDERQLEQWFKNMFLRVIANMETSYQ
jgi:TP901 family phage tail tape measure protein